MKTKNGGRTSSGTSKSLLRKLSWTGVWITTCAGLVLGLYVLAVSGLLGVYLIRPYWPEGNNMHTTLAFFIVATLAIIFGLYGLKEAKRHERAKNHYYNHVQQVYKKQNEKMKVLRDRLKAKSRKKGKAK